LVGEVGAELEGLRAESGCRQVGQDSLEYFSQLRHRASEKIECKSSGGAKVSQIQQRSHQKDVLPVSCAAQ
jgi:hypothetical protein